MHIISPSEILNELTDVSNKLAKGYEALQRLSSVAVGTTPKKIIWRKDSIELSHYIRKTPATIQTPVLLVYALVNRHNMMDLQADRSFVSNLLDAGLDLFLINWRDPQPEDKFFSLDEYVNGLSMMPLQYFINEQENNPLTLWAFVKEALFVYCTVRYIRTRFAIL